MGRTDGVALAFTELRKESQDLYNRIHSIAEDAAFVDQVRRSYPSLPLVRESYTNHPSLLYDTNFHW